MSILENRVTNLCHDFYLRSFPLCSQPDFKEWSQERDPDGVAWQYKDGQFVPLEVSTLDSEPSTVKAQPKPSKSKTKTKSKTNQKQKTVKKKTTKKTKEKADATTTSLENRAYTVRQVMARFHCGAQLDWQALPDRLLRIKRSQPDFTEWSQQRDPEGIAWQYQDGQFVPLEVSTLDSEASKVKSSPKPSKSKTKTKSQTKQKQKTTQKKKQDSVQTVNLENATYSGRQLMQRFRCGERLLRIKRSQPDFSEWSQKRDPDGMAWKYQKGQFVPNMG